MRKRKRMGEQRDSREQLSNILPGAIRGVGNNLDVLTSWT